MTDSRSILAVFLGLGLFASEAGAAILANYDFESTGAPLASVDTDPNSVAQNLLRVPTAETGRSTTGASPNYFIRTRSTPDSYSDTTGYFSFTVTADEGFFLSLESLQVKTAATAGTIYEFNGTIEIRSSVDGFAAPLATYSQTSTSGTGASEYTQREVEFTGPEFQGLSEVTFRLHFYDDSNETGNTGVVHRIDDLVLNGTVVPEAGTVGLAGLAGAVAMLRRRRVR